MCIRDRVVVGRVLQRQFGQQRLLARPQGQNGVGQVIEHQPGVHAESVDRRLLLRQLRLGHAQRLLRLPQLIAQPLALPRNHNRW